MEREQSTLLINLNIHRFIIGRITRESEAAWIWVMEVCSY